MITGLLGVVVTIVTWQYPKPTPNTPSVSDYETAASHAVEAYFRRSKCEEADKKYLRTFTLSSKQSEGWVDTGIVLRRNHKIFIRRTGEEDGTRRSDNYWAIKANDPDRGSISDRWDDHGGYADIDTNHILGNKQQDTLKVAAYWEDQDPITIDVIIDAEKWMADYPCDTE